MRIRDADAALASHNFAALRQLLSADARDHDELIAVNANPAHLSRGMSGLVASSEREV